MPGALVIGGSDGIGLALTEQLLDEGWHVHGLSRSEAPVTHDRYTQHTVDVRDAEFTAAVASAWTALKDATTCIYCVGMGEFFAADAMDVERTVFEVNLIGAIAAAEAIIPSMVAAGCGHFIALSSQADTIVDEYAPSYAASKAGLSSYLHGLALALRPSGVAVTNVRFGFVDTKMAKSEVRPFLISADKAAAKVRRCMRKRPIRYTYPKRMAALLWFVRWGPRMRIWAS